MLVHWVTKHVGAWPIICFADKVAIEKETKAEPIRLGEAGINLLPVRVLSRT